MFKEDTNYKFKSEDAMIKFSEISNANLSIARSISKAGGVFKVQGPSFSSDDYYFIYVNGAKLIAGNNITPVLTKNEYHFFEEVVIPESKPVNKLDVFDKAVKSVREYRSERPFTKEDEALIELLRFAVSAQ